MENVKIAVVDGDATVRAFVVNLLTYCVNRHVLSFEDAESAWDHFQGHADIDIFVLEVGNSGGLDVLERIKERDAGRICVAMSSSSEDEQRAGKLGADAFLAKPFGMDDLFAVVQSFVAEEGKSTTAV